MTKLSELKNGEMVTYEGTDPTYKGATITRVPVRTLTQEIADYLGVTEEVGLMVRDCIDAWIGLDWSECTTREMHQACDEAYAEILK